MQFRIGMGAALLLFFLWCAGCIAGGVAMLRKASERRRASRRRPTGLPIAQVVIGDHSPIEPQAGTTDHAVGATLFGWLMIGLGVAPPVVLAVLLSSLDFGGGYSKGRLLRLRGKSLLPDRARGEGWSDGAMPAAATLDPAERRVLAEAWLVSAQMEHASIAAFSQLSLHLAALGAPSALVESTHRAALDEIRHARRCYAFAAAYGGEAWTAGPIRGLRPAGDDRPIDLVRLAIGSLVDGCVAEGIAADVAARGGRGAIDPVVRAALTMIARDEDRHAELAWSVLGWCLEVGGEPVCAAVAARVAVLDTELAPAAPDFTGIAPAQLAPHGLFDQATLGEIATVRIAAVRARAGEMTHRRHF